jgi:hypothetical protein
MASLSHSAAKAHAGTHIAWMVSGIDIEPNGCPSRAECEHDILSNVTFRNISSRWNNGAGFQFAGYALKPPEAQAVSIIVDTMVIQGTAALAAAVAADPLNGTYNIGIDIAAIELGGATGSIEMRNVNVSDCIQPGLEVEDKVPGGTSLLLSNVRFSNVATAPSVRWGGENVPLLMHSAGMWQIGGMTFTDCAVEDSRKRPFFFCDSCRQPNMSAVNIHGSFHVKNTAFPAEGCQVAWGATPATNVKFDVSCNHGQQQQQQQGTNLSFGQLVDLKPPPSLGVSTEPAFSWVVPTSPDLSVGQRQGGFRLIVTSVFDGRTVCDSGWVRSSEQSHVHCSNAAAVTAPHPLKPATKYHWTVQLKVVDADGGSITVHSEPSSFVTALGSWDPLTKPIWAAAVPPPPAPISLHKPPSHTPPRNNSAKGRFIKPHTDYPTPPGIPGLPGGSMFYERFNDSTIHFVTNCPEHPQWCGAQQQGCYQRLHSWLNTCAVVSDSCFKGLRYVAGQNFTCAEEPSTLPPSPPRPSPPVGFQSFAMARTEISLRDVSAGSPAKQAFVFVTAAEVHTSGTGNNANKVPGQGRDVHARRLLAQYHLHHTDFRHID